MSYLLTADKKTLVCAINRDLKSGEVVTYGFFKSNDALRGPDAYVLVNQQKGFISNAKKWARASAESRYFVSEELGDMEFLLSKA